jgi:hypothetical protein
MVTLIAVHLGIQKPGWVGLFTFAPEESSTKMMWFSATSMAFSLFPFSYLSDVGLNVHPLKMSC